MRTARTIGIARAAGILLAAVVLAPRVASAVKCRIGEFAFGDAQDVAAVRGAVAQALRNAQ